MKVIKFLVASTPDKPAMGYHDYVEVTEEEKQLHGSHASTCPIPYRAVNKGKETIPWTMLCGWIACGEYTWKCVVDDKFGKCIAINNRGPVASRTPNPINNGEKIIKGCLIHIGAFKSKNPEWRASLGCCTIPRHEWDHFIACFEIGEAGKLIIEPFITSR